MVEVWRGGILRGCPKNHMGSGRIQVLIVEEHSAGGVSWWWKNTVGITTAKPPNSYAYAGRWLKDKSIYLWMFAKYARALGHVLAW